MDSLHNKTVNAMPAPTWYRLKMNGSSPELAPYTEIVHDMSIDAENGSLDAAFFSAAGDFDAAMSAAQDAWLATHPRAAECGAGVGNCAGHGAGAGDGAGDDDANGTGGADQASTHASSTALNAPAQSLYQQQAQAQEDAHDIRATFETGMGAQAEAWFAECAQQPFVLRVPRNTRLKAHLQINAHNNALNCNSIDVIAEENADLALTINVDSPHEGAGALATQLRIFAADGARVSLVRTQTLNNTYTDINNIGFITLNNARVTIQETVLGATNVYGGIAGDLRGDASQCTLLLDYLGFSTQLRDFNYSVKHHGLKTECLIKANGVLTQHSKKVLRGTIDLIHGCKGSAGQENETVLLVDDDVENLTVPVILCNEDDVAGNHGATIGHVRAEQMFYLASRGLSKQAAEQMFVSALLEKAALNAAQNEGANSNSYHGICRLGSNVIDDFAIRLASHDIDLAPLTHKEAHMQAEQKASEGTHE